MFLIVFVTLMISVIGLYAQVLSLQAAKVYNSQVGLMQMMVAWHGGATNLARANAAAIPTGGCNLTAAVSPPCGFGALAAGSPYLPSGYSAQNFSFYSIAYQNGGANYVITFVHDTDTSGNLVLPRTGGTSVGYTMNSLMRQFAHSAPAILTYGSVTSAQTLTIQTPGAKTSTGLPMNTMVYTNIPTVIPVGSLAIISAAQ
ncbi:MAG: hypothetical protein WCD70_02335 [Alphaproteobacteria bacterium]